MRIEIEITDANTLTDREREVLTLLGSPLDAAPETKPKPKTKPKPEPETKPKPEPEDAPEPEPKPEPEDAPEPEPKPEPEPEDAPEPEAEDAAEDAPEQYPRKDAPEPGDVPTAEEVRDRAREVMRAEGDAGKKRVRDALAVAGVAKVGELDDNNRGAFLVALAED